MTNALWAIQLAAQAILLWRLYSFQRTREMPWFTAWLTVSLVRSTVLIAATLYGWNYSLIWLSTEWLPLLLLACTVYEAYGRLLTMRASGWTILLLAALVVAGGACLALLWPDEKRWWWSSLESMFQVKGAVSLMLAVGLIGAMSLTVRATRHTVILTIYLIGTAAGYIASPRTDLSTVGTFCMAWAGACFAVWAMLVRGRT